MRKRNKIILTSVICFAVLAILLKLIGVEICVNPAYEGASAVMCHAVGYRQSGDTGYLTIVCDTLDHPRSIPIRVEDGELQNELASRDMKDVIGVHVGFSVPYQVWSRNHVQGKQYDLWDEVVATDAYDPYLVLMGVSFDE